MAATSGAATTQRMIVQASASFQKTQVGAEVSRGIRETNIGRDQQVGTAASKEKVGAAWESHAAKQDLRARNLSEGVPPEIPIIRPVLSGFFQGAHDGPEYARGAAISNRNQGVN